MASGKLGSADLSATTNTTVYTVPASTVASCTVRFCNRSSSAVTVRLAISTTGTPADADYLEYGATVPANGIMEDSGLVLDAGKLVVAYASATGISVNVYGFEEVA